MNKKITLFIIAVFAILNIANAQVNDTQAKAIVKKVSEKSKAYKNMKFDFQYRMLDKAHDIDNKLKGSIVMEGDKYNLHIMSRNIVSDGTTIWTYDPSAEELQISNAGESKDAFGFLKLITSIDDNYNPKLIKTITENGKSFYIVDLTPKTTKSYYKVRVKIDKVENSVQEATIYQKDNVEYTFSVVSFSSNLTLKSDYFTIKKSDYPDAEVIDVR